jgi:hypothetical protein
MNAVFKIIRYPVDYPGLAGKDLTPKGHLVGMTVTEIPENYSARGGGGGGRGAAGGGRRR